MPQRPLPVPPSRFQALTKLFVSKRGAATKMAACLGLAAGAALSLSSCCTHAVKVTSPLPKVVIDAHSHLFNAYYLPIREICISRGVPPRAAEALEVIVLAITGNSHLGESGFRAEALAAPDADVAAHVNRSARPGREAHDELRQQFSRALDVGSLQTRLTVEQRRALRDFVGRPVVERETDVALTVDDVVRALQRAQILADAHRASPAAALSQSAIDAYLRFFSIVISSERTQLRSLSGTFPKVNLFVSHMMDLQKTYGEEPTFPFALQVRKMIALQNENPGRVLMFGAFDPFRRATGLEEAKRAYEQGVIGFKFYPPDGYRPAANDIPPITFPGTVASQWRSRYEGIDAGDLNDWNKAFFAFCVARDIPVFLHCTPMGFEAVPNYGQIMADPKYWETILANPNFKNLRLCFGHAGGTGFWFDDDPISAEFGRTVIALCERYDNVYCDAGYWDTVLTDTGVATLQQKLPRLFADHPKLARKLVYGTDWFMVSQVDGYGKYLAQMAKVFSTPELAPYRADFFGGNEARYLKLRELARDQRLDASVRAALAKLVADLPP